MYQVHLFTGKSFFRFLPRPQAWAESLALDLQRNGMFAFVALVS